MRNQARTVIDEILCSALVAGSLLVLLVPAARGMAMIGWLPMWLVGMPAVAWWAARGFAVPDAVRMHRQPVRIAHARRVQPQARRSSRAVRKSDGQRAAA